MDVKKINDSIYISDDAIVRLKETGNITEIMYSEKRSKGGYITKINKDYYCDNRTGEIFEFKHIENRSQDLRSVSHSLERGRDILNTNITDVSFCRWLTFTYSKNMTNPKKLQKDFENCVRELRKIFGHFEYITAAEPQGRGALHLHAVFIFPHKAPYMANDIVAKAWNQGFVTVKRLDDVDNVGAYLTAYLGDMELSEAIESGIRVNLHGKFKEVEYKDDNGNAVTKKFVKGARLRMYPPGFRIFRWSTGIKEPDVSLITYKQAKKKVCSAKQTFSKTVILEDPEKEFKNTLQYEYYNSIKK